MPGTILSHDAISTRASNPWALAMSSTLSATNSRLGREACMPACPMARPSQMPMVLNSKGVPPVRDHAALYFSSQTVQVDVAGYGFGPGVGNTDEWLFNVLGVQTQSPQQ
jgi:hypothetical protein